ncbi:MAG: ribosome small subunit-dependent GTPase A [Acidobacteria bacterium]|nr:ribosome small subunit-dependent GTPase A [Acidobacteriota bacterium]
MEVATDHPELVPWGWNSRLDEAFRQFTEPELSPGRVLLEFNQFLRVAAPGGEILAEISGKLRHAANSRSEMPAVGDWVVFRRHKTDDRATILAVLPRRSGFARKVKGTKTDQQVIAANIDTVFLVTSLNQDFNLRRIERYLSIARESGADPVILLTKSDLCASTSARLTDVQSIAPDLPVHAISALHQRADCLAVLSPYLISGHTIALIGSSGVGKSTLLNQILGEARQTVSAVRGSDDRGQHTTRHRELIRLPNDTLVIDTPGIREIQLWDVDDGIESTFGDIETLAESCRFSNCQHRSEPGCAVQSAIADGRLAAPRLDNYRKLRDELGHLAERRRDSTRSGPGAHRRRKPGRPG